MLDSLTKAFKLLTPKERRYLYFLLPWLIVIGIIGVVGVACVVPFMAIVVNPKVVQQHKALLWLYQYGHFSSINHFLMFVGVVVLLVLVFGDALSAFVYWLIFKFVNSCGYSLINRLYTKFLSQSYTFFLDRNSSDLSKHIFDDVKVVTASILTAGMQMLTRVIGALFVIILLVMVNPLLALITGVVLGGTSILIFNLFKHQLNRANQERFIFMQEQFRIILESFGGIKEIKLFGRENYFLNNFQGPSKHLADLTTLTQFIGVFARYLLEILAFGGMIVIVLYLLSLGKSTVHVIPLLALYAFAGYRLMPALQGIFVSVTQIKSSKASLDFVYQELVVKKSDFVPMQHVTKVVAKDNEKDHFTLTNKIELKNINFSYPRSKQKVIKDLNLTIYKNTTIGLVGETGGGKSTLIDIILGLLIPQEGQLKIDNILIDDQSRVVWQKQIGYVPQHIFLSDDTIANNIAFAIPENEIDYRMVEMSAKIANIHEFIKELPRGYKTVIGERGVRLSGGQRQRLGIARALYHDPNVIILDEATNSLDGITEIAVMEAIHNLSRKKTIVIIAHRLLTLKECDVVYFLENGQLADQGSFQSLLSTNKQFQRMAYQE